MYLNFQVTTVFEAWSCFNLLWYLLVVVGGAPRNASFNVEGKLDVTPAHDLYIYPLWAQIQLHSIKSGAGKCLLNCLFEGFLLDGLFSSCRGSYLPLLILFSCLLSPFLSACLCFPFLLIYFPLFLLSLSVPALLNISSYVSDTFAKISWTAREEQRSLQLYVAYMNNRKLLFLSPPC